MTTIIHRLSKAIALWPPEVHIIINQSTCSTHYKRKLVSCKEAVSTLQAGYLSQWHQSHTQRLIIWPPHLSISRQGHVTTSQSTPLSRRPTNGPLVKRANASRRYLKPRPLFSLPPLLPLYDSERLLVPSACSYRVRPRLSRSGFIRQIFPGPVFRNPHTLIKRWRGGG
jgi:hypothetical protein